MVRFPVKSVTINFYTHMNVYTVGNSHDCAWYFQEWKYPSVLNPYECTVGDSHDWA